MNGSMTRLSALTLLVFAMALGCSDGQVSIGDKDPATASTAGLQVFVGQWDGYIQAHTFIDGSDRVRLSVGADGKGTIRFGNTELWPKATDPNAKYPPDFPQCSVCQANLPEVWDGFAYTLNGVLGDDGRLRATAGSIEVFKDWCELQTTHHYYDAANDRDFHTCSTCASGGDAPERADYCRVWGTELCAAGNATGVFDAPPNPPLMDLCEREVLCQTISACDCDANGCTLAAPRQDVAFDGTLLSDQSMVTGTLVLWNSGQSSNYTVVLKRQ